ncbi:DUF4149 domain-containing protein [Conchiformibius kuhniae]|uniref:DUF4149 domain-containing protein n=1 Tax=Conchiformibius kuhniae TaxID=211502 RepID=A0A8T9MVG6_9NEIS|nr:DUF4149 domain-containing protein [Conchiformibius kuhniae]
MKRLSALAVALWLGMQIGFYAASLVLFNQLDKTEAGRIAGILFHIANWTGLAAWSTAWLTCRHTLPLRHEKGRFTRRWIALLLTLLAFAEWVVNPVIHALKHGQSHWLPNLLGGGFGAWHGTSYILYLIISLMGLGLGIRLLRLEVR